MHDIWWIVLIVYPPLLFIIAYTIRGKSTLSPKLKKITTSIPKRLFICVDEKVNIQPWIDANPDYTTRIYTLSECRSMLQEHISMQECFDALPNTTEKITFWSIAVLYLYGGVVVDAKQYHPILNISSILPTETTLSLTKNLENTVGTAFLAATQCNPVFEDILNTYKNGNDIPLKLFAIDMYDQKTTFFHEYNPQSRPLFFNFQNELQRNNWKKKTEIVAFEGPLRLPFMAPYGIL